MIRFVISSSQVFQNMFADICKIVVDGTVGISQNGNSERGEISIAFRITFSVFRRRMLNTIHLDHEFAGCNIEIDDILTDGLLPIDCFGKRFQKPIPEFVFFRGHFLAEGLRNGG